MATPDTEEALIEECLGLSTAALDRVARRANPPSTEDERSVWERRRLGFQWNLDQSELNFRGSLPGAEGRLLESAVRDRADRIPVNPETGMFDPYPARLADGLVELAATSGDQIAAPAQITVFADLEALIETIETTGVAELEAGPMIPNETARRLSWDGIIECTVYDHSRVLGIGRRSRLIPSWLPTTTGTYMSTAGPSATTRMGDQDSGSPTGISIRQPDPGSTPDSGSWSDSEARGTRPRLRSAITTTCPQTGRCLA
jgi:hypothetical protein